MTTSNRFIGILFFAVVMLSGCATRWESKYGEPTNIKIDELSINVYMLKKSGGTYEVVAISDAGFRAIQPLEDLRRYHRAAETIMVEKCGDSGSKPKILFETNQEGVAGRFFEYECR